MSEQGTEGAKPPETPAPGGAMPPEPPPAADAGREAPPPAESEEERREAQLSSEEVLRALRSERRNQRETEKQLRQLQEAERQRQDAGKSELQRVTEERDELAQRVSVLERTKQASEVAVEFGVPEWAEELAQDEDTRTMRAHAQRIRDRLGRTSPGMDGGVRGMGIPPAPQSMDDMIRAGVRR